MSTESKSRYAIMGMLSIARMSGYKVRKYVEETVGQFWSESYGQIYPVLKQLVAEGLAEEDASADAGDGRPERRVYALTEAGRAALAQWLAEPVQPVRPRKELLLKLFFADQISADAARQHLLRHRARMQEDLAAVRAAEAMLPRMPGTEAQRRYWRMTTRYGIHALQADIDWCEESLAQIALWTTQGDSAIAAGS